jgi:type IV pilus assembly protein PilB
VNLKTPQLGTLLLEAGIITPDQLNSALEEQSRSRERLGALLVRRGNVSETALVQVLSRQLEHPVFDPAQHQISYEALSAVPFEMARKYNCIPVGLENGRIVVAMSDTTDIDAILDIEAVSRRKVSPLIGLDSVIREARERHYGRLEGSREVEEALQQAAVVLAPTSEEDVDADEAKKRSEDAPIVNLVNQIISQALSEGATDIHVEPQTDRLVIRYRVDGLLYDAVTPPLTVYTGVITRIKILAQMDIAERRAPQGGRFTVRRDREEVDVRVSTIPTIHGEKAVLRLLSKTSFSFKLEQLGFEGGDLAIFREAIRQPYGMVLLSGPTGSGKSTTLYAGILEVRDATRNIMTVEDPVEYHMARNNQVQVNERKGLDFASALRTFLRQDPDVIMVGEIRDKETAEISVRAAMTGHMVFSTIHANDAPSTAVRLVSLNVEPFQAASCMTLVAAQRLVRRVCPLCAVPYTPPPDLLLAFARRPEEFAGAAFKRGKGCPECKHRGYRGRTAILELMRMDPALRELVAERAPADQIRALALTQGMRTLKESGLAKAMRGETTVDEVLRVCLTEE